MPFVFKRNTRLNSVRHSWKGISLGDRANMVLITNPEVCSEGRISFSLVISSASKFIFTIMLELDLRVFKSLCLKYGLNTWAVWFGLRDPASPFRHEVTSSRSLCLSGSVHGPVPITFDTWAASSTVKVKDVSLTQMLSCWPPWTASAAPPRAVRCSCRNLWIASKSLRSLEAMECHQHTGHKGYLDLKPHSRWMWVSHLYRYNIYI